MLWIILTLALYIAKANTITIPASTYYSIERFTCNTKNIKIDLQFTSNNTNVNFYTTGICSSESFYASLSVPTMSNHFTGTLYGITPGDAVCFRFHNTNFIRSTKVTYSINPECIDPVVSEAESALETFLRYLIVSGPIILGLMCCGICIRYFYNRGGTNQTFVKIEQQSSEIQLKDITPVNV